MHRDPSIFMVPQSNPSNSTVDKTRINPNPEVSAYAIDIFNCKNCKKRPKFDDKGKLYDVCNVCLEEQQIKQRKQHIIKKTQFKYKKSNKKSKKKSKNKSSKKSK